MVTKILFPNYIYCKELLQNKLLEMLLSKQLVIVAVRYDLMNHIVILGDGGGSKFFFVLLRWKMLQ